jgi:hypothetical protein
VQYLESTEIECYAAGKGEERCLIASVAVGAQLRYGTMPGDQEQYAVAFVDYEPDTSGNAAYLMAIVFKSGPDGAFVPLGRAEDIIGTDPRNLRFERGAITYTGTVVGPGDARCCATGKGHFRLLVSRDSVKFVELGRREREAAETGSASVPGRSKAAQYLVREQIAEACDGKHGKIDPGAVIERDLTGDGRDDLIISHEGITCGNGERGGSCGMQVCSVMIYIRRGALLVLAREMLGAGVTVRDAVIHMHAHGGKRGTVKWNGREFR